MLGIAKQPLAPVSMVGALGAMILVVACGSAGPTGSTGPTGSDSATLLPAGTTDAQLSWKGPGALSASSVQTITGEIDGKTVSGKVDGDGSCPEHANGSYGGMAFQGTCRSAGIGAAYHVVITGKVGGQSVSCDLREPAVSNGKSLFNLSCVASGGLRATASFPVVGDSSHIELHVTG
jgi:hypothetical protein